MGGKWQWVVMGGGAGVMGGSAGVMGGGAGVMGGSAGFGFRFFLWGVAPGVGAGSQLNKCLLKNSRHIMPIMIDPVDRLPTEHDLHVGDDIIVNAGKRSVYQGGSATAKRKSWISHLVPHTTLRGITQRPQRVRDAGGG
jgi:hypothetical protein